LDGGAFCQHLSQRFIPGNCIFGGAIDSFNTMAFGTRSVYSDFCGQLCKNGAEVNENKKMLKSKVKKCFLYISS
jgi:hypothetical protein